MGCLLMAAALQHMAKGHQVAVDVGSGILQGVAHARLRRQVDHRAKAILRKEGCAILAPGQIHLHKPELGPGSEAGPGGRVSVGGE